MKLKWEDLILRPINLWSLPMGFIAHHPCPKCRSKDNLGEYDTNFYCFGCGYYKPKEDLESLRKRLDKSEEPVDTGSALVLTKDLPSEAKKWLLKYGITEEDCAQHNFGWSEADNMLVLYNSDDYWQGRMFGNPKRKYMSKGKKPLLFYGDGDTIVCVEDIISAIKVAKAGYIACPLLGSHVSEELQNVLISRRYPVVLWLDYDKAKESVLAMRNLQGRSVNCSVVMTAKDPKEYTIGEINGWLRNR